MSPVRIIGLTAHRNKEGSARALEQVSACVEENGMSCVVDEETARALGWKRQALPLDVFLQRSDLILSLGGDGTLLQIAGQAIPHGIPVGGINLGRLGFLTAASLCDFRDLIRGIAEGRYLEEKRSALEVSLVRGQVGETGGEELGCYTGLNEVAIVRGKTGRMVDVETFVNGEFVTNYHADGLLVATPSGSTAYSLSAGGPLISPGAGVLCLTPVSPHSLTNRSLVVSDSSIIEIRSRKDDEEEIPLIFSVDGHEVRSLGEEMFLRVKKASSFLHLVRMPGYSFLDMLRAKLHWRGAEF